METIMAVAITRRDVSMGDVRREAGRTRDAKAARRMLAIACVMEGQSREDAAKTCGMDRQTLRDWVYRSAWFRICPFWVTQVAWKPPVCEGRILDTRLFVAGGG